MGSVLDLERLRLVLIELNENMADLRKGIEETNANMYIFARHVCRGMQHLHDYVLFVRDDSFTSGAIWEGYMETDRVRRMITYKQQSYAKCVKFIEKVHLIRLLLPMGTEYEMTGELVDNLAYRAINQTKISEILRSARTWLDMSMEDVVVAIGLHRDMDMMDTMQNV
jgi:hypothetical protein